MKLEDVKQLAVIGAGNMGAQIAQLISQVGGYQVTMMDVNDDLVQKGLQRQRDGLKRFFVDKNKMTAEEMEVIIGRIKGTTSIPEAVKNADFVVEAAFENLELKKNLFKQIDEATPTSAIIWTRLTKIPEYKTDGVDFIETKTQQDRPLHQIPDG